MPKNNIDYSNTIIYKIYCNDTIIKTVYIGHTTNYYQRKCAHKNDCNNINSPKYLSSMYTFIRNNGGWYNWTMIEIAKYNCLDSTEARIKEHYHNKLENGLNTSALTEQIAAKITHTCNICDITCSSQKLLDNHNKTIKHITKSGLFFGSIGSILKQSGDFVLKFDCEICDFKCSKKSKFDIHLQTNKHKMLQMLHNELQKKVLTILKCECGKEYKHRQSLYVHKKKCFHKVVEKVEKVDPDISDKEIIKMLLSQNNKLLELITETNLPPTGNTTNNTINNTTNNFNLNVFLNETCKDALNLADFVSSLQVKLKDLEETAKIGYTQGVSRIFINGLNELEVNMRPIHCSDAKRETLYIKNNDEWAKEDPDKTNITKAIKKVSNKNIQQVFEWQKKYPEYKDPESKQNDKYQEMLFTAMGGSTDDEQTNNLDKIIRNITKEVVINKTV